MGIWTCVGACATSTIRANSGIRSIALSGGFNPGQLLSLPINMSGYDTLIVSFLIYSDGLDGSFDLFKLQISGDGGTQYSTVQSLQFGDGIFTNPGERWISYSVRLNSSVFSPTTTLRMINEASSSFKRVFLDDVRISRCIRSCRAQLLVLDDVITAADNGYYGAIEIKPTASILSEEAIVLHSAQGVSVDSTFSVVSEASLTINISDCN